jgi:ribose transport system permease protein
MTSETLSRGGAARAGPWRRWRADWLPAALGALLIWVATGAVAGQGFLGTLQQSIIVASFLALVGFGEVFVISTGSGNIDLSVPYVVTLSAYLSASIMRGSDATLLPALVAILVLGPVVGIVNFSIIRLLSIPPLVATLAVGFVLRTVVELLAAKGAKAPSPALIRFAAGHFIGVSPLSLLVIAVGIIASLLLTRARYGREVLATGQSPEAARLAGIATSRIVLRAYMLSGGAAAICGLLLGAYSNGPSLDMAEQYQLGAIAVVVLGGSAIAGGRSNVAGVWWAALLLTLLATLVSLTSAGPGVQHIAEGAVIVGVLAAMPKR